MKTKGHWKITLHSYRFRLLFGIFAFSASAYNLLNIIFKYSHNLISYTIYNFLFIIAFFILGYIFDRKYVKVGLIATGSLLAFLPWFSSFTSPTIENNLYNAPLLLFLLMPEKFQQGHPPLGIFIIPVAWILFGVFAALILYMCERKGI